MKHFTFRRPELALDLCNKLEGSGLTDVRSGLFMAAPRRVGKSTFLKEDLVPEVVGRGWLPVYLDLWTNKDRNPALLIADAIKAELQRHEGVITRAARAARLSKVSVLGSLTIDLTQPGLPDDVTLADVLAELYSLVKKPIVLIVDEAQHALSTASGLNAMFALKAARDKLNTSSSLPSLMPVFTGSNRDQLRTWCGIARSLSLDRASRRFRCWTGAIPMRLSTGPMWGWPSAASSSRMAYSPPFYLPRPVRRSSMRPSTLGSRLIGKPVLMQIKIAQCRNPV